jgi:hypothetical protein
MTRAFLTFLLLTSAVTAGCAGTRYRYSPTEATEHTPKQITGATYPYPPGSKESFVRVDSFGFEKVEIPDKGKRRTLWMYLMISNRDRADWKINLRDCRIRWEGGSEIEPSVVRADSDLLPWLTVHPAETRIANLFFELPEGKQNMDELPQFEFYWKVDTMAANMNYWTPFAKAKMALRQKNLIGAPFLPGTQNMGPMIPGMR